MTLDEMNAKYGKPPVDVNAPTGPSDLESAWGLQPEPQKPASFMDSLTGKAPDTTPDVTSAMGGGDFGQNIANHVSEAIKHPIETGKGILKGIPGAAADVTKLIDTGISKVTGHDGTMLDYGPIEELTAPSNTAQETGDFIGSMLPAERALTASKPLVQMGEKYLEKKGAEKTANFLKDLITPELTQTKGINAIKTGKVTEGGITKDRDITEAVPFFDSTLKAVSEVPGISKSKTLLENNNAIHDHIGTIAEDLKSQIKGKGFFSPNEFNGFMKDVSTKLEDVPSLTRDAVDVANKYLNQFNKLVKKNGYTPEGLLQARKEFDNLLPSKQVSPDIENGITEAVRAIRQGANDFLASKVPDVAVKDMLAKQTSLYNAIENIAPKAFKEGSSGFKRWIKAHPKLVEAAKYTAGLGVGAGTIGVITK